MSLQIDDTSLKVALQELELRHRKDPMKYYEAASPIVEQFHRDVGTKIRILIGGNRSSKTHSALQELLWYLRGEHPYGTVPAPPISARLVVPDFSAIEKVIMPKLTMMMPPSLMKGGRIDKAYNNRTHILKCSNGSIVDIISHEQPMIKSEGSSKHFIMFDEEPPEDIYISNLMRTTDTAGAIIMAFTPLTGLSWSWEKLYRKSFLETSKIKSYHLSTYDNKFLSAESIAEIEDLVVDETDRQIRLYGQFTSRLGLVFTIDPNVHVYHGTPEEWDGDFPPWYFIHIVGIDPGWKHPTGVVWLAVDPETENYYFYDCFKKDGLLPEEVCEVIKERNETHGGIKPIYVIDSQANATDDRGSRTVMDYRRAGINPRLGTKRLMDGNLHLARIMKIYNDEITDKLSSKFHISYEYCTPLLRELTNYERKTQTADGVERYQSVDDDLIAAARYAVWEAKKAIAAEQIYTKHTNYERKGMSSTGY